MTAKSCKECEPASKRPAPHPGPRCATHHRERVRERKKAAHGRRVEQVYGISAEDYWRLYDWQNGACAICERAKGKTKRLAVDHDHETGEVRGLLCSPCNRMLGHGRDDREFFRRAEQYLNLPPYSGMQLNERAQDDRGDRGSAGPSDTPLRGEP